MQLDIGGKPVPIDDEGYLIDPDDWNEQVAEELARQEHIDLTREHWVVIRFMREYYEQHHIAPDARHVIKYLARVQRREARRDATTCSSFFPTATSSRPARSPACAGRGPGARAEAQGKGIP